VNRFGEAPMQRRRFLELAAAALALPAVARAEQDAGAIRLEGTGERRRLLDAMCGKPPPALDVQTWIGTPPLTLAELRGKVVLLDFWGKW